MRKYYDAIDLFPIHHVIKINFKTVQVGDIRHFFVFVYVVDEKDPIIFTDEIGLRFMRRWLGDFHEQDTQVIERATQ